MRCVAHSSDRHIANQACWDLRCHAQRYSSTTPSLSGRSWNSFCKECNRLSFRARVRQCLGEPNGSTEPPLPVCTTWQDCPSNLLISLEKEIDNQYLLTCTETFQTSVKSALPAKIRLLGDYVTTCENENVLSLKEHFESYPWIIQTNSVTVNEKSNNRGETLVHDIKSKYNTTDLSFLRPWQNSSSWYSMDYPSEPSPGTPQTDPSPPQCSSDPAMDPCYLSEIQLHLHLHLSQSTIHSECHGYSAIDANCIEVHVRSRAMMQVWATRYIPTPFK